MMSHVPRGVYGKKRSKRKREDRKEKGPKK
jgi:hypothetical protein